jgi:peroxiredoxin-like protein
MKELPHHYNATASARPLSTVNLESEGLPNFSADAPAEFGGPGNYWSPETLFVATVASCFILTFKAVSRASKLEWEELSCEVEGILDKEDKQMKFTELVIKPDLAIKKGGDIERAEKVLEKAERSCLVTNSMNSKMTLKCNVREV